MSGLAVTVSLPENAVGPCVSISTAFAGDDASNANAAALASSVPEIPFLNGVDIRNTPASGHIKLRSTLMSKLRAVTNFRVF